MASFTFIDNSHQLQALVSSLEKERVLAVDTEFMRDKESYWPRLGLIQIATAQNVFLIDPLKVDLGLLKPIFFSKKNLKVFHASSQDLEAFYALWRKAPSPIFDTQVAASYLGWGKCLGYDQMVQKVLGVHLDKTLQRYPWLERPLSPEALSYAAQDVYYLFKIHKQIAPLVGNSLDDRFQRLCLPEEFNFNLQKIVSRFLLQHPVVPNEKMDLLEKIIGFREELGRKYNLYRSSVFSDSTVLSLLFRPPTQDIEFQRRFSLLSLQEREDLKKIMGFS